MMLLFNKPIKISIGDIILYDHKYQIYIHFLDKNNKHLKWFILFIIIEN